MRCVNSGTISCKQNYRQHPIRFQCWRKETSAGRYSVSRVNQTSGDAVLSVADDDGNAKVIRLTNPTERLRRIIKATLVFHHYGDQYFLFQVWLASS